MGFSESLSLFSWHLLICNPNIVSHHLKTGFTANVSSWLVLIIKCTYTTSLKWATITLAGQIIARVDFPNNWDTNPGWTGFSWRLWHLVSHWCLYVYTPNYSFFIQSRLRAVPNMQEAISGKSYISSMNHFVLVPDFRCRSLDTGPGFGWYWHFWGTCIDVSTF